MISLGMDTSCWQERLLTDELTLEGVLEECGQTGGEFLQMGPLEPSDPPRVQALVEQASALGFALELMGGPIGIDACDGSVERGVSRVDGWLQQATALGSRTLLVYAGFLRYQKIREAGRIAAEMAHLAAVLARSGPRANELGVRLLIENSADFKAVEVEQIVTDAGVEHVGVLLDVTNTHAVFDEPNDAIRRLAPIADAGHVKDFTIDSIWPPAAATREHRGTRRGFQLLYCYPGEGISDLAGAMSLLSEACRGRTFLLAIEGQDSHTGLADQIPRVKGSLSALRRLLPDAS